MNPMFPITVPQAGSESASLGCSGLGYWDVNASNALKCWGRLGPHVAQAWPLAGAGHGRLNRDFKFGYDSDPECGGHWHGRVPRRCCSGEPSLPVCHRAPQAPSAAASTVRCPPFSSDARGLGDSSFKLLDPTQAPSVTDSEGRLNASAWPASGPPGTRVAVKSV